MTIIYGTKDIVALTQNLTGVQQDHPRDF